jgi:hypothetical protein
MIVHRLMIRNSRKLGSLLKLMQPLLLLLKFLDGLNDLLISELHNGFLGLSFTNIWGTLKVVLVQKLSESKQFFSDQFSLS